MAVNFIRTTDLLDHALVEHCDAVRKGQSLLLIVGDVNGSDAEALLQVLQLVTQLNAQLCVKVGQRLVQADDLRVGDQRTGDGDTLLLTAGQLGDLLLQLLLVQIYLLAHLNDLLADFLLVHLLDLQAEGDVLVHGHGGEQSVALEHHADVALFDGGVGDVLAADADSTGTGRNEAGDGTQGSGLATAGGSKEGEKLTFVDVNVDVFQGFEGAKSHFDMFKFDHALYLDDEQLRKKVGSLYCFCKPTFPHYCKRTKRITPD